MPVESTFRCMLASGLHARPCSHIAEIAARFNADGVLTNRRNGRTANLKSVLSLISADVLNGDDCLLVFKGVDEAAASAALDSFLKNDMAAREEPPPYARPAHALLPRALRFPGSRVAFGAPLSPGFGQGKLRNVGGIQLPRPGACGAAKGFASEEQSLDEARIRVRADLKGALANASQTASSILTAHLAILDDIAFTEAIAHHLHPGKAAGDAIIAAANSFTETLSQSESAYIRERALDIQEVSLRLYEAIYGSIEKSPLSLQESAILVGENIGAHELLHLDREHIKGIVFGDGQATSHAVILARSLGIPAIAGAAEVQRAFAAGEAIILDGTRGFAAGNTSVVREFYQREARVAALRRERLTQYATVTGVTADSVRLEVGANVSSPEEAEAAFKNGCDGIGLFRTEMLFVGRASAPTEEEQFTAYARTARAAAAAGKSAILRTFDVGGDKPAVFLPQIKEDHQRGILIYKENPGLLRAQLRAMLRASANGRLRIMVPLISSAGEIQWVREQLDSAKRELRSEKHSFDANTELGVMVELPDAVANLGDISAVSDFFSIGTNDLAQYFFAEDRIRSKTDLRKAVREPAFLRMLFDIAQKAKAHQKWIGMCGEMAGDPRNLALLAGLGLDEISIGGDVLQAKSRLAKLNSVSCELLLKKAITCATREQVEELITSLSSACAPSLVGRELVVPSSKSRDRDEVIREMVDLLLLQDRTADPDRLEDALWEREASYPTDMGLGFALPHCKSSAVQHSSVAVIRPESPFFWSPESTVPVRAVIMLAMKDEPGGSAQHMQVLSRLARKLMDDDFRERLLTFKTGDEVVELLTQEVGIT